MMLKIPLDGFGHTVILEENSVGASFIPIEQVISGKIAMLELYPHHAVFMFNQSPKEVPGNHNSQPELEVALTSVMITAVSPEVVGVVTEAKNPPAGGAIGAANVYLYGRMIGLEYTTAGFAQ